MSRELELVHALADGELSAAEEQEARQLIQGNPQLQAEYEWALELKSQLSRHCKPIANDEAWRKCIGRLDDLDRVSKTEGFIGKYAWAFCGVLLLTIFVGGMANRAVSTRTVKSVEMAGLLDPFGSAAVVEKEVPQIQASNFVDLSKFGRTSVVGGLIESRPFVRYGLRDQLGLGGFALAMIQGADRIEGLDRPTSHNLIKSGQMNGINAVTWPVRGDTCVLFGERDTEELVAMAEQMMR
jgi:hypothetical protein